MTRLVLAALVALALFPFPASATKSLSGGVSAQASVHRQTASYANGDSGVVGSFDNTCGAWAVSHFVGGGGGGVTEVYGSRDGTTAAGELLATLSTTSAVPIVVRTAYPRIVVNINTAPAAGTDAKTFFVCSAVATGGGAATVDSASANFWLKAGSAANMTAGLCFEENEGEFSTGLPQACTVTTAGVDSTTFVIAPGRVVVARRLVCSGLGTAGATPPVFGVVWRSGAAPGTQTDSTVTLTFPNANYASGAIASAEINSTCPYTASGCYVGVRIRTAPGAGAANINQNCDLFLEVS
jgi:hypothetical protein